MSAVVNQPIKSVLAEEWHISPSCELEADWEHAACCAEAHQPGEVQPVQPQPLDPDEWWPESCVA